MDPTLCYSVYLKDLRALLKHTHHSHLFAIAQAWVNVRQSSGRSHAPILLAITLYGEARAQPTADEIAIVDVIANRCRRSGEPNIDKELLRPFQFSSLNHGNGSLREAHNLTDEEVTRWLNTAQTALDSLRDPDYVSHVANATIFCTERALTHQVLRWAYAAKPHWNFSKLRPVCKIGDHIFFEETA